MLWLLAIVGLGCAYFLWRHLQLARWRRLQERWFSGDPIVEEHGAELFYAPRVFLRGSYLGTSRIPCLVDSYGCRLEGELRASDRGLHFRALLGSEAFFIPRARVRGVRVRRGPLRQAILEVWWERGGRSIRTLFQLPERDANAFRSTVQRWLPVGGGE